MPTLQLGQYTTIRTSTTLTIPGVPVVGNLLPEAVASWVDEDGATNTTGFVLPKIYDRATWFDSVAPGAIVPTVASATQQNSTYNNQAYYDLTLDAQYPLSLFKKNEKLSFGTFGAPNTYLGAYDVHCVWPLDGANPTVITVRTNHRQKNSPAVAAGSFVGTEIYQQHSWAAAIELGLMKVNLGVGYSGTGTIRMALIQTSDPITVKTYAQRLAAKEVAWTGFYPVGSQTSIDFAGTMLDTNGYFPPTNVAPAITGGAEKRNLFEFFWETTSGAVPVSPLPIDIDITYKQNTVIEQNGVRQI